MGNSPEEIQQQNFIMLQLTGEFRQNGAAKTWWPYEQSMVLWRAKTGLYWSKMQSVMNGVSTNKEIGSQQREGVSTNINQYICTPIKFVFYHILWTNLSIQPKLWRWSSHWEQCENLETQELSPITWWSLRKTPHLPRIIQKEDLWSVWNVRSFHSLTPEKSKIELFNTFFLEVAK